MIGDLSTGITALRGPGPLNITLIGDSNAQGLSQIAHRDSIACLLEREIRSRFPLKAINFQNLSIPGVSWGELCDDGYTGVSFPAPPGYQRLPPAPALWPNGVVSSQSWITQAEATDPHIAIFWLGTNASSDLVSTATLIRQLVSSRLPLWVPKTSIVFVTPAPPSTSLGGIWPQIAADAQGGADALREIAAEFNATIVDVNALYRLLLEGVDVTGIKAPVVGPTDYPSWTTVTGNRPTLSGGTLNFSGGWGIVHALEEATNTEISGRVSGGSVGSGGIWYRFRGPGTGYLVQLQRYAPQVVLYQNGVEIAKVAVASAADYRVHVEAVGCRHKVWVNGVLAIDVRDYKQWRPGRYGVEATGGTISEFSVGAGYPDIADPLYTELDLLGPVGGTDNGNGINHYTKVGHRDVCLAAFMPVLDFLQTAARLP